MVSMMSSIRQVPFLLCSVFAPRAHSAERFGHDPAAMLFIDDNLANIESARECGWQVHHFTEAEGLERDLAARGLV